MMKIRRQGVSYPNHFQAVLKEFLHSNSGTKEGGGGIWTIDEALKGP